MFIYKSSSIASINSDGISLSSIILFAILKVSSLWKLDLLVFKAMEWAPTLIAASISRSESPITTISSGSTFSSLHMNLRWSGWGFKFEISLEKVRLLGFCRLSQNKQKNHNI